MPPSVRGVGKTVAMKTVGLLGGMSWESSVLYEELINTGVRERLGGVHSADLIIRSYDFAEIEALQSAGDWDTAGKLLADDAGRLVAAGAELILLCTNTMHRVADVIEDAVDVPFIHLADTTATAVKAAGLTKVALLGTRFTMEQDFYKDRLATHGIEVIVPPEAEREQIHRVIYDELVQGELNRSSREDFLDIIDRLGAAGAEGVVAGCTEIELLVTEDDVFIPYFATTRLHAEAAVVAMLD